MGICWDSGIGFGVNGEIGKAVGTPTSESPLEAIASLSHLPSCTPRSRIPGSCPLWSGHVLQGSGSCVYAPAHMAHLLAFF